MRRALGTIALILAFPTLVQAQEGDWEREGRSHSPAFRASIGFTASPETFLMTAELPIPISPAFEIGPLVQVGVSHDQTIVAPTLNARFNIAEAIGDEWEVDRIQTYLQAGLGLAYIDRRFSSRSFRRSVDDVGFLMNVGFGFDVYVTPRIAIGSNMLFNVLPVDTAGEHFFYSWQLAAARFHF